MRSSTAHIEVDGFKRDEIFTKVMCQVSAVHSRKPFCGALAGKQYGGHDSPFQANTLMRYPLQDSAS
jgi:hypothetical protein